MFAEDGPKMGHADGRGPGGAPVIVMNGNIMLPEVTSAARALQELDVRLRVAAQGGFYGVLPGP